MKKWIIFVILGTLGIIIGIGIILIKNKKWDVFSPLGIDKIEDTRPDMRVVGFLPSWNINKAKINPKVLDELIFLGIESDENGRLIWDLQSKKINNSTYLEMKDEMRKKGKKNIVGIKLFDDNKLDKLLNNDAGVDSLVAEIEGVVLAGNFDGVNIDFEYQGDPTAILSSEFFSFLNKLREAGVGEIGVDVFCNTIIKGDKEMLNELWSLTDYVLVMAYDFTRPGVDYTGPVAPIKALAGKRSIWETLTSVVDKELDTEKVVVAYPLYGYEWKTETNEFGSKIIRGWYQTASLRRVKELLRDNKNIVRNWDELSLTPWLVWKEEGVWRQIYYDDEVSLKEKFKLAIDMNVGGVGFWALGYEGESKVWEVVDEVLK